MSSGAQGQTLDAQVKAASQVKYHLISQLSTGPAYGMSDGKVRGKYIRLVVYEAELAYDPPSLRIEQFTYGDEGCCKTLRNATEVEIGQTLSQSIGRYSPEKEGLTVERWVSPTKVEISYQGLRFILSDLDKSVVKVKRADR
jgi:hypothetical protein